MFDAFLSWLRVIWEFSQSPMLLFVVFVLVINLGKRLDRVSKKVDQLLGEITSIRSLPSDQKNSTPPKLDSGKINHAEILKRVQREHYRT
jgi:hypothetical protein